ncbi:MAG: biotin--[acetyl-CoA-carboxylase] ligase [Candidatus Saganbacteria bacterium]|nr:biotin--[acetyl-CoA-carboxylase] ligase [Candidatus Saganbacteria bacterium]
METDKNRADKEHLAGTRLIGRNIYRYDRVSSTNDVCRMLGEKSDTEGLVIIADVQDKGRGRFDRKWYSRDPGGLYFSILLRPSFDQKYFPLIGLSAASCIARAIFSLARVKASVKWPNDVLINGKKAAGILIEQKNTDVIAGIGINLSNETGSFPPEIRDIATSVLIESGIGIEKELFFCGLLRDIDDDYFLLSQKKFGRIIEGAKKHSCLLGREVLIEKDGQNISGIAADIDGTGALIIESQNDKIKITSGEIIKWRQEA